MKNIGVLVLLVSTMTPVSAQECPVDTWRLSPPSWAAEAKALELGARVSVQMVPRLLEASPPDRRPEVVGLVAEWLQPADGLTDTAYEQLRAGWGQHLGYGSTPPQLSVDLLRVAEANIADPGWSARRAFAPCAQEIDAATLSYTTDFVELMTQQHGLESLDQIVQAGRAPFPICLIGGTCSEAPPEPGDLRLEPVPPTLCLPPAQRPSRPGSLSRFGANTLEWQQSRTVTQGWQGSIESLNASSSANNLPPAEMDEFLHRQSVSFFGADTTATLLSNLLDYSATVRIDNQEWSAIDAFAPCQQVLDPASVAFTASFIDLTRENARSINEVGQTPFPFCLISGDCEPPPSRLRLREPGR